MSPTRLTDLARSLLENATQLEEYFTSNSLPQPTFDEDAPGELPLSPEMRVHRQKAVDLATELRDLLLGPANLLRPVLNGTALQAIYEFRIPHSVPFHSQISFSDLSSKVGLPVHDLTRILRFSMIHHRVFHEPSPGFVAHTAASKLLATDPAAFAALGYQFDECYRSFAHTVEAMRRFPGSGEPDKTGWSLAFTPQAPESMWAYHSTHPELGARASLAMDAFAKGFNSDTSALTSGYDFGSLGESAKVVDLGGANGHVAFALARENPGLTCVVQDIPEVIEGRKGMDNYGVPEELRGRVSFMAHDFFKDQPVEGAEMYLLRQVLHNWSDAHCVKILRGLRKGLKNGSKVLVNDHVVPPPGKLVPMLERAVRSIDMIMLSLFNSREREAEDWKNLFREADERFVDVRVWQPEGSQLGLIEAVWSG